MHRAVIVGAGGMGRAWGRNLRDSGLASAAGWVDLVPERAAEAMEECGFAGPVGTDLSALLEEVKPDFVIDVTVPEAHRDTVMTALRAGYPVLGEKPMAESMESAIEMVDAAAETGLLYMVSQSRRYIPSLEQACQALPQIGPLSAVFADFFIGAHFGGFRDEMPSPLLLDMSIHHFDGVRKLTGLDPVSVYCEEWNPGWSWYQGAPAAECWFEMTGGVRFGYRGMWCAEGQGSSWNADWRCVGRDGWLRWDGDSRVTGQSVASDDGFMRPMKDLELGDLAPDYAEGIGGSLREFLACLDSGARPQGACEDNILSLAMVFAALESSKLGRRVAISEVLPPRS